MSGEKQKGETVTTRRDSRQVDRKGSKTKKLLAVSATAVLASLAVAVPVLAATPPVLPRDITIFPERDFVAIDGYRANTNLNVNVIRGGDVVGTARGTTDATGFLEVNHPGGVCWSAPTTPDLQPGDRVQVRNANFNINDSNITQNAKVVRQDVNNTPANPDDDVAAAIVDVNNTPANPDDDNLVIKGTAQTLDGTARFPLDRLEQRIIQPELVGTRIGRRDIRADSAGGRVENVPGGEGNLSYDSATFDPNDPNRFNWTATYTGLNEAEINLAAEGQARILSWLRTTAAGEREGITIFEDGEVGGPGFGGCPPGPEGPIGPNPPDAPVQYDNAPPNDYLEGVIPNLLNAENLTTDAELADLHEVVVFPKRDFVVAEGSYPNGTDLNIVVRRPSEGGAIVGTARGTTAGGILEVNHPGGECWTGQTPDIKPDDIVDVVEYDDGGTADVADDAFVSGETQRTINVTAGAATRNQNGTPNNLNDDRLIVRGTAVDPNAPNGRVPLDRLEQRIINPDLNNTRIGRRDIRADSAGGRIENVPNSSGGLAYDSATSSNWTATYRGLNNEEMRIALQGQVRILSWLNTNAAGDRFGITIYERGEVSGPGFGGCPQAGDFSLPLPKPAATP